MEASTVSPPAAATAPAQVLSTEKPRFRLGAEDLLRGLQASQKAGRSTSEVVRELFGTVRGPGKLSVAEYFYYGLQSRSDLSLEERRAFLGLRFQQTVGDRVTAKFWRILAMDKVVLSSFLRGEGLPTPEIVALHHPARTHRGATRLATDEDLARYLREDAPYPLFGKPVNGMYSLGSVALDGYDASDDCVLTGPGGYARVEQLVTEMAAFAEHGYLFQRRVHPHDAVAAVVGDRLATVRAVVLLHKRGEPELFRCVWKLPAGENTADNFWRPGNMLAELDLDSGRVLRVVRGKGPDQELLESHPDTGERLTGFAVPRWRELRSLVLEAALRVPGMPAQAWDVAVCSDGVQLMELNVLGDFNLAQVATGRGMADDRFRAWMKEYGVKFGS